MLQNFMYKTWFIYKSSLVLSFIDLFINAYQNRSHNIIVSKLVQKKI